MTEKGRKWDRGKEEETRIDIKSDGLIDKNRGKRIHSQQDRYREKESYRNGVGERSEQEANP